MIAAMTDDDQKIMPLAGGFPVPDEAQWRALVDKVLTGADFRRRLVSRTADGIEIEPLYTRAASLPEAGQRRAAAGGWRIAQVATGTTPEAVAAAFADDIAGGAEAVTIRLAAPGQSGLTATRAALDAALADVPARSVRVSLAPGANALEAATALADIAPRRGLAIGSLGIDPLGTLARTGERVLLAADGLHFTDALPWLEGAATTLLADARPYHEAGASEAQEIAALAATLVLYMRCAEATGQPPARALPRIGLALAADADLFLTIAKLRAARRVVARIAEACGAGDAAARMALAITTSERMMARRDPWVNLLRVTAACAAAAMAGADEIAVLPHTWALGEPDAFARRIARNVGLVLREEAGLGRIGDPAGGAWYVERLTAQLAERAWGIFQAWEGAGGMHAALRSGRVQDEIAAVADARAKDIATRKIELTGVSAFPQLGNDGVTVPPWPAAPALTSTPAARRLAPRRLAEPFEKLRDAADRAYGACAAEHNKESAYGACAAEPNRMSVFLASLGTQADFGARAMWITNLLAAGGIVAIAGDGLTNSADVGRAFAESGAAVACLVSSDEVYGELGEAAAMALKGAGARHVCLAGRPGAQEEALKAAGVDAFLYAGMDVVAALTRLQGEYEA
jgi:methylmalonyl-CoA mutase